MEYGKFSNKKNVIYKSNDFVKKKILNGAKENWIECISCRQKINCYKYSFQKKWNAIQIKQ